MQSGRTALHVAASKNKPSEMVELLLKHKASIDLYMQNGRTALLDAAKYESSEAVELLLKHKAAINLEQEKVMRGWTCGGDELVLWLLRA